MKNFSQFFWVMLIMNLFYVSYAFGDIFEGFESGNSHNWDEHSAGAHSVTVQSPIKKTKTTPSFGKRPNSKSLWIK